MRNTVPSTRMMFWRDFNLNFEFYKMANGAIAQSIVDTPKSVIPIDGRGTLHP
jgi:hypothetical protein